MRDALRLLGRHGAAVVIAGVIIGLCIPYLSDLARPYLAVAIFIFTFGSFLKFDANAMTGEIANWRNVMMVAWATFGMPSSLCC